MRIKDSHLIRFIGFLVAVNASIFCFCGLWRLMRSDTGQQHKRLKLVSIFSRHGDRSPADSLPVGDRQKEKFDFFWPNGFGNITEVGKFRMFRLGLENRRQYNGFIGYDSTKLLALSSSMPRCQESLSHMLQGMFTMDITKDQARAKIDELSKSVNRSQCLPDGSGTPAEWRKVRIDTETVPALIYKYLDGCKYRAEHPSPVDADLLMSAEIKALPGIEQLQKVLMHKYNQRLNFSALDLYLTLAATMTLERTTETIDYAEHYADWVNRPITSLTSSSVPLFDLYEQATVIGYRDRLDGEANYIQSGSILTSLIESQLVALGQMDPNDEKNKRAQVYEGKRMVLYSSHDTVLQRLLFDLGVLRTNDGSFEDRFNRLRDTDDDLAKFLAGLKMCSYGLSFRVELFESELESTGKKFHHVEMSIYNKEDAKFQAVQYERIEFGSMCRSLFLRRYKNSCSQLMDFYDSDVQIDRKFSCPFNLFRNITSHLMIEDERMKTLCGPKWTSNNPPTR